MYIDEFWAARRRSPDNLLAFARIRRHRRAFHACKPDGEHQFTVRERLLGLLDEMEEVVCEEGPWAAFLDEAWERVDELEKSYWEAGPAAPAAGSESRPAAVVVTAAGPSPEGSEAPVTANQPERSPKAA